MSWISYTASTHLFKNGDIVRAEKEALAYDHEMDPGSTSIRLLVKTNKGCPRPNKVNQSSSFPNQWHFKPIHFASKQVARSLVYLGDASDPLAFAHSDEMEYPHGAEVRFDCLPSSYDDPDHKSKMRSWKIKCKAGAWVGQSLRCDEDGRPHAQVASGAGAAAGSGTSSPEFNSSCAFVAGTRGADGANVVTFFGDERLEEGVSRHFEPGAELVHRCVDIGKYEFEGGGLTRRQRCVGGMWDGDGVSFRCLGLNQLHGYDLQTPPTILIRSVRGRAVKYR